MTRRKQCPTCGQLAQLPPQARGLNGGIAIRDQAGPGYFKQLGQRGGRPTRVSIVGPKRARAAANNTPEASK